MIEPRLPGEATLVASWRALARTSPGAIVTESLGSIAAVFPAWTPLNNAIARVPADDEVARLDREYLSAGIDAWAYWVPSRVADLTSADQSAVDGMVRDETTLVMRADLGPESGPRVGAVATSVASAAVAGDEPVVVGELGDPELDPNLDAWVMVRDGLAVAGLWAYVHEGDCGIYAVGTAPEFRSQGIARSLIEHALDAAAQRGARTASLQSTPMGVSLYRTLGFDAVGRYEEWSSWSNQTRSSTGMPSSSSPAG